MDPPRVLFWHRLYCGSLAVFYAFCLIPASWAWIVAAPGSVFRQQVLQHRPAFALFVLCALCLMSLYVVGAFLPRRPWAWALGLACIVLPMLNPCGLVVGVLLIPGWRGEECRLWFGRR